MNRTILIILLLLATSFVVESCKKKPTREDFERQGQMWLKKSRESLRDADYSLARNAIDSLRRNCPEALNAREEGILLLDSIELREATEQLARTEFLSNQAKVGANYLELDSIETNLDRARQKVRFFEKKLQHDIQNKKEH